MAEFAWAPGASLAALQARARLLARVRGFFAARDVMEVETPLLASTSGTDPALEPLRTRYQGPGHAAGLALFLQTSPEFAMKRLLAAGSGAIYQICKAFRDGESGRRHNPEFTIVEWYRPGFDLSDLIAEVAELVRLALAMPTLVVERIPYQQLFARVLELDVLRADPTQLRAAAQRAGVAGVADLVLDRDGWLDLLMSHALEPTLGRDRLTFITDYPASQAALARLNPDGQTAARFELYYQGVELANGFHELVDTDEQAARFETDNCARRRAGRRPLPVDCHLLAALEHGIPDCAGVALGLDRLLMLGLQATDLDQVIGFTLPRC